jgi:nicotinate-nucleotide pyrophosphorylase (carboxylating)
MKLDPRLVREYVRGFLAEDIGRGDRTTEATVPADARGRARIEAREPAVIAGLDAARACFEELGGIEWDAQVVDGESVLAGAVLARISGSLRSILTAERTALNLMQRMSGIATLAARYVTAVEGTGTRIVDTRKTSPGLRMFEKYAVLAGGASNHRFGLDDGVLIKDNHIVAAGGVTEAVHRARTGTPHGLRVEVEVTDLVELADALAAGADAILLDNMTPGMIEEAVKQAGGKALLEASGGIKLGNVRDYALTGVDLISVGALTHSAGSIDLALEVEA